MQMRHPHIKPDLYITVPAEKVAAHVAAGWLPEVSPEAVEPEPEGPAPKPSRLARRAVNTEGETTNGE